MDTTKQTITDPWKAYSMRRVDIIDNQEVLRGFLEEIAALPSTVRDVMFSIDSMNILISLGEDFELSDEQSENLTRISRDTLLCKIYVGDMVAIIAQKLNVDKQTAQQIRDRIVKELFAPAIEDIKKIQREKFQDKAGQGKTNEMPQPPAPPQMKNAPPVNQENVIDLRNQS